MTHSSRDNSIVFHSSWNIDDTQLDDIIAVTPFSYYFLYGPSFDSTNIRVIPALTIRALLAASEVKTLIQRTQIMPSSRTFPEFLVNDFIGCWVGDERKSVITAAGGKDKNYPYPARYIINISITTG
jgi:hypothetical protein